MNDSTKMAAAGLNLCSSASTFFGRNEGREAAGAGAGKSPFRFQGGEFDQMTMHCLSVELGGKTDRLRK